MSIEDDLATLHSVAESLDAERMVGSASDVRESVAALSKLIDTLTQERDEAIRLRGVATEWAAELAGKKRAAEAEAARLRDGLRWMAEYQMTGTELTLHIDFQGKARALLADQDGTAQLEAAKSLDEVMKWRPEGQALHEAIRRVEAGQ